MKILRSEYPTFEEMLKKMGVGQYSVGDRKRLDVMIDAMRLMRKRKWWERLFRCGY